MPASRLKTFDLPRNAGARDLRRLLTDGVDEETIHFALVEHIQHRVRPGVFWTHVPSGERRPPGVGGKLKGMGLRKGVPDFHFLIAGQAYYLELKRVGGKTSREQREAITDITAAGGIVEVAEGLDEALRILAAWGIIR